MSAGAADDELAEVVRLERSLLDPALRSDGGSVADLLHADYVEYGRSGRVWDRDGIVAALVDDPAVSGPALDLAATRLSDDVVLVTYRIDGERASLRSSIWVREGPTGWRLRFHQGTATG